MKKKIIRKNKTRRKKQKGGEDTTQLIEAIKKGDLEQVKNLVSSGVDVNDDEVISPLGLAAARGHLEIVKFLLDSGAEVDKTIKHGNLVLTALTLAAQQSRTEVVKLLIERGADVNYIVIFVPDPESTHGLNSYGIKKPFPYDSVLTMALNTFSTPKAELVKALLDAGANPNVRFMRPDDRLSTPLMLACNHGSVEIVEALLDKGVIPYPYVNDGMGSPPIWYALHNSDQNHSWAPHVDVIRALVNRDPRVVNQRLGNTLSRTDGGATPLEYTVSEIWSQNPVANPSEQERNLIELFLDNGAVLNPVISHMGRIGNYINNRIISKGLVTKERVEELLQEYKDDREKAAEKYKMNDYQLRDLKEAFDTLDSQILKGIKDGSLTEQQAEELGFIEKYNEMLEKRELLEQGIEKMKKNAEENEEERVKNTGEKKRRFGTHIKTHGLAHEVEEFLGGKRKKTRKYKKKKNKSKKRVK